MPTECDRIAYQTLIDQLGRSYNAPSFAPHVTIYLHEYDPTVDLPSLMQAAISTTRTREETAGIQPFCLTVDRVLYSPMFTKTLFVQFHPHPVLTRLCDNFRTQFNSPSDYVLNPHLSLIYGSLQEQQQQQLVQELSLPGNEVWFDAVSAIVAPPTLTQQDVDQWQLVHTQPF